MKFGAIPIAEAENAVLAHTVRLDGRTLKKGERLTRNDVAALDAAGFQTVTGARLEPGDIDEDTAAVRLARSAAGPGVRVEEPATGRANLFAEANGILMVDPHAVDRFNRVHDGITIATLPAHRAVTQGEMVATVKIIPFAVPEAAIGEAEGAISGAGLVAARPFRARAVGVVATVLPQSTEKMLDKTMRVLRERLAPAGATILEERRVAHDATEVAEALRRLREKGAELLLVYGASAIVDEADVIPAGIAAAGGEVGHFGMPVDPGNLLLVGELDGAPVIGAPGCARSPKENGFDWVLQRVLADLPVGRDELTGMGVGGLLMEIVSRPQPREATTGGGRQREVAAIVLAAGRSRRMGAVNKLLEDVDGAPLVRHAARAALESRARPVIVVTGHEAERVGGALEGLDIKIVDNPAYGEGLSASLRAGIEAVPESASGALICLGDMPRLAPDHLDRLIDAFEAESGDAIIVPTVKGKRGNPVLWPRRYFAELARVRGDVGGRHLIGQHAHAVLEVEMADEAVFVDVDTPEVLARLRGRNTADQ